MFRRKLEALSAGVRKGLIENISHDPGHGSKEGQEENRTGKTLRQEALDEER